MPRWIRPTSRTTKRKRSALPSKLLSRSHGRSSSKCPATELQDTEEVDEVLFLFVREPNLEAAIEVVQQFGQVPGGTVGEVGRAGRESAELLHHDRAGIRAFSGDECTAGVLS